MAGLYLHIPFCVQKCRYCAFYSVVNPALVETFVDALCQEIQLRSHQENFTSPQTVYFGGGTPSLLSVSQLSRIIETIDRYMGLQACQEMTLEVNPEHICVDYLRDLQHVSINRISMGVQSFDDQILKQLGRRHDACSAKDALSLLARYGFDHCSIDLMYGIPGLSEETWRSTLEQASQCAIEHLSAYALTVEPQTLLYQDIQKKRLSPIDEDQMIAHYHILQDWCDREGFEPYETSSYARGGCYSRHNCHYWDATPYMGCGPGAHSFDPPYRRWNSSDVSVYNHSCLKGDEPAYQREFLSEKDRYNEYVMLAIRTRWGIDPKWIRTHIGYSWELFFLKRVESVRPEWFKVLSDATWVCTSEGRLMADAIAVELMAD